MTDKTNQQSEVQTDLPEVLFEDAKTTQPVQSIEIKYNGEKKTISLEEAAVLAQKGMNYDHVVSERDSKYKRELDVLERYAAMSGMSREEYVRHLEAEEESEGNGGVSALLGKYPELTEKGVPEYVLDAIARGENPLHAYESRRISELTRELEELKNADLMRARAVGSARGAAMQAVHDEFLEGFLR